MGKSRALGRGLSSLIPHSEAANAFVPEGDPKVLSVAQLRVNPYQPRRVFDQEALDMLSSSIKEHGLIQPILVRKVEGAYEIVAGERRWRAAQQAGLKEVPVHILELTDNQSMELALVENIQREDLNALDVALGINELIKKFNFTHEQIAKKLGWSRASITNKLRLLQLPDNVMSFLTAGELSEGHARSLLAVTNASDMLRLAQLAISDGLSVRQLEEEVKQANEGGTTSSEEPSATARERDSVSVKPPFSQATQKLCKQMKVKIKLSKDKSGTKISLQGLQEDQLARLCVLLEENLKQLLQSE